MDFKFAKSITDDNVNFLSIINLPNFPINVYKEDIVLESEAYRPDKISFRLFNEEIKYDWVLMEINNFNHPFADFYPGRKIKYISYDDLIRLGL